MDRRPPGRHRIAEFRRTVRAVLLLTTTAAALGSGGVLASDAASASTGATGRIPASTGVRGDHRTGATATSGRVRIAAHEVRVDPSTQDVRIRLTCPRGGPPCAGTLTLRSPVLPVHTRGPFRVPAGSTHHTVVGVGVARFSRVRVRAAAATAAGTTTAGLVLVGPSAADRRRACRPAGARRVLDDGRLHLWVPGTNDVIRGCLDDDGLTVYLPEINEPVVSAGTWVASATEECDPTGVCYDEVAVIDVRKEDDEIDVEPVDPAYVLTAARPIALRVDGVAAWIACAPSGDGCRPHGVRAVVVDDARHPPRVLERGHRIHATGLRFDGHGRLRWRTGTELRRSPRIP